MVTLEGNTHPKAVAANDLGAATDSLALDHMWLQLQRPPELEQQLVTLIDQMHTPGSPQFHKWLTAAEFGRRFGASPQDINKITGWLTLHGFKIDSVFPSGMMIEFSGNAGQVRSAFHTQIHNLKVNGESHIANMGDPQIPAALQDAVKGVVSLHNFRPHTNFTKRTNFNVSISGGTYEAVAPADLATIYNLNPLFAAGITGVGQTIVVIEDTLLANTADVATFRSAFGLSGYPGTFSQITPAGTATCNNSGVNGDESEAALDAEWAGASAPGATIVLASCKGTTTVFGGLIALQNLINGPTPPAIVSISYGECEVDNLAAGNASYVSAYQQAVALGMSIFVSSGDSGAAGCDQNETAATHGIAVNGFASTPYNVAVGGTDFSDFYSGTVNTYWNPTNNSVRGSAISYIPEIPWNDSCAGSLLYTIEGYTSSYGTTGFCNSSTGKADFRNTGAGSSGPSSYSTLPGWQTGVVGIPAPPASPAFNPRLIPDISLFAANGLWGHFLLYCLTDASEGGVPCDYTNATDVNDLAAGGTSFSSPIMAGIMALVIQQQGGAPQGNPNTRLYPLAAQEYGPTGSTACNSSNGNAVASSCVFYDVTLGDNVVNCTGATNCFGTSGSGTNAVDGALSVSSSAYTPAYLAGTGWDLATGIGTLNAYNLVYAWTPTSSTTAVTSSLNPAAYAAPITFTATITSQNPAIGGTVAWSANTGCGTTTVTAGSSTGAATCLTSTLPTGTDTITATYSGDLSHIGSVGTLSTQVVTPVTPTVTFTGAPVSAAYKATFTVATTTNASTTPTLTAAGACTISGTTVTMASGTGTCSLTASWAADANYKSATATQATTATRATPTVTFTGAPASAAYNSTFTIASTTNATTTPAVVPSGGCSVSGATVTMTSGTGTCSLVATWAADTNYSSADAGQSTAASKASPVVTWAAPAAMTYGNPLSSTQLNATASVPGTFAYTPSVGTVLPAGANQTLAVLFTPTDSVDYTTAAGSTSVTVNSAPPSNTPANLVITKILSRDGNNNVVVALNVTNIGGTAAANVVLTTLKISTVSGTPLPQTVGTVAPQSSVQAIFTVPGSVGASGAASSLSAGGTYTGGTFSSGARITLP